MEDGKLTSHLRLKVIQERGHILCIVAVSQLIGQHIGPAHAYVLHHGHRETVEHKDTERDHRRDADPKIAATRFPTLRPIRLFFCLLFPFFR